MNKEERVYKVFVDFDGTITTVDVGEAMFLEFGDSEKSKEIVGRWMADEITSMQCWQELCETIDEFDRDKFDMFLDKIEIDPSFKRFVEFCEDSKIDIIILSDGLHYYIERILKKEGLERIKYYSNQLLFDGKNKLVPDFPYTDEECSRCANCKRNHIINNSSDDDFTIYIGDGTSDTCPAQFVDFIFAKNSLLKFCEKNRISYFPYKSFAEVRMRVKELTEKRKLKKRHQAELKRREVYLQG